MAQNTDSWYEADARAAEYYDHIETGTDDIDFIRSRIEGLGRLRILEPFCGTGRILIPLAQDGHEIVGMDKARHMLDRAKMKIAQLPNEVQGRITLMQADVIASEWPKDFDVVVLGGNCFYELSTPLEQEERIASAARSLKVGGHIFVDNDHMEGDLAEDWARIDPEMKMKELAILANGIRLLGGCQTIGCDIHGRIWRAIRKTILVFPDGHTLEKEYIQQKHPVSIVEVRGWLDAHGFVIECYNETPTRATYWGQKVVFLTAIR